MLRKVAHDTHGDLRLELVQRNWFSIHRNLQLNHDERRACFMSVRSPLCLQQPLAAPSLPSNFPPAP
jgi:hypothetical protein